MAKFYNNIRKTQIKTGAWTLIILLLLIFSYLWFTNRLQMKAQHELKVLFSDVMGLEVGDKIMYRGMEAGRIKSVTLYQDGILVSGKISSEIRPPVGSRFIIEDSLMGSKSLLIIPSDGRDYLDLDQIQPGENPIALMSLISTASNSLNKLDTILANFDSEHGLLGKGERLLGDASGALRDTRGDIAQIKDEISATIRNLDSITRQVDSFVQKNQTELDESISLAPAALNKLSNSLDSLNALSAKLSSSVQALQSGKGTAGKLLTDDELYGGLKSSIQNLESLIGEIKKNPKKYLKISVF